MSTQTTEGGRSRGRSEVTGAKGRVGGQLGGFIIPPAITPSQQEQRLGGGRRRGCAGNRERGVKGGGGRRVRGR